MSRKSRSKTPQENISMNNKLDMENGKSPQVNGEAAQVENKPTENAEDQK